MNKDKCKIAKPPWVLDNSYSVTVNVSSAGTITGPASTCPSVLFGLTNSGNVGNVIWQSSPTQQNNWTTLSQQGQFVSTSITQNTDFRASSTTNCPSVYSPVVTVPLNPVPTATPTVSNTYTFATQFISPTASGAPDGTYNYVWYNGTSPKAQYTGSTWRNMPTSDLYGYVDLVSSYGCEGPKVRFDLTIYDLPAITAPQNYIVKGGTVPLTVGPAVYDMSVWENSASTQLQSGPSQVYVANTPDTYTVTVTKSGVTASASYTLVSSLSGVDMNYIITNTPTTSSITDLTALDNYPVDQVNQSVIYFDGLGRPVQSITTQGSLIAK